jgi:hypothetical protein
LKLVVELGVGDGRYLCKLSRDRQSTNTLFIGIESNDALYSEATGHINADNVVLINDSFETRIKDFVDETIDQVIMILPDPEYVDRRYYDSWIPLYENIFLKLKKLGTLEIITEIIDDLLQLVSDAEYYTWAKWLLEVFVRIGFGVEEIMTEAPDSYTSTCLDRFRQDPKRIRLLTLKLFKPSTET